MWLKDLLLRVLKVFVNFGLFPVALPSELQFHRREPKGTHSNRAFQDSSPWFSLGLCLAGPQFDFATFVQLKVLLAWYSLEKLIILVQEKNVKDFPGF